MQNRDLPKLANMPAALVCSFAVTLLIAGSWHAGAQTPGASPATQASSESLVRLPGHTPRQVLSGAATRVSHYDPNQKLRLAIFVTPRDLAGQEKLLNELQDKNSPNFHKFLSAEEWNARFAPRVEDEQAVVDWANSQGFTVTNRFENRMLVDVEAPSGVIEKALNITINKYQVGDEVDFSNDRDPTIPARLSAIIGGIFGLESIERVKPVNGHESTAPHPDYLPGPAYKEAGSMHGDGDPSKAPWAQAAAPASATGADHGQSQPASSQGDPNPPNQIGTMDPANLYSSDGYSLGALYGLSKCCNVHNDSTGSPPDTSIALVTFANFQASDVVTFFQYYGLAYNINAFEIDGAPPTTSECAVGASGCPGLGDDDEADLDVEWSTAFSNSFGSYLDTAHVYVYEGGLGYYNSWFDIWNYVLSDGHAHVASTSWAWTEEGQQSGDPGWMTGTAEGDAHYVFNALVGQGNTIIAAAGDQGPTSGCTFADQVFWPANDPDVLAAGGTSLTLNYDGTFANETSWVGGPTAHDCQTNGGGGGGGVSNYFSAPSWQSGIKYEEWQGGNQYIVSKQTNRMMPDLSLNATGDFQWYYCTDPACPKVTTANGWQGVGGTSIVAPELAGFYAQVNSYLNSIGHICGTSGTSRCEPIGNPSPLLYWEGLGHGYAPHDPFYDTTQDCVTNYYTMNDVSLTYFCAEPGYDLATGWGSANLLQLAWMYNWNIIPADGVPAVQFTGPAKNTWYNTDQVVSWTVSDGVSSSTPGLPAPGVAGFTQGWDSIPSDPYSEPHGGEGNSFYSGPQYPQATKGCLSFQGAGGCSYLGSPQGCHTVNVEAWDNQGNGTGDKTYGPICYDTVPPTITMSTNPKTSGTIWVDKSVVVTLTATDPGGSNASGIYRTYYGVNTNLCYPGNLGPCAVYTGPFTISTPGQTYVYFWTQDNAGNVSNETYQWISIDETPPVTTAGFSGVSASGIWTNTVLITLTATDNASGVANTYYTLDGGSTITYSGRFSVSTVGTHTLDFWSVDEAGNTEKTNIDTFKIASSTSSTLVPTPNPSVSGQSVTLKATVTATDVGTPTGTITFLMGSTKLGSATLSGGTASIATTALPIGTDALAATFSSATTNYINSTSATVNQVVKEPTTTAVIGAPNPVIFGNPVTFTATVKPSVSGTPAGKVEFLDGTTDLGTGTLSGSDVATLTTSALSGGNHYITAMYTGSATYAASTSSVLKETVDKDASATALTVSSKTATYGEAVTFTATVTSVVGTPTGTVTFLLGTLSLGTGTLSDGVATLGTTALPVGTDSVHAEYNGSSDYHPNASAAVSVVVSAASTTTKVSSSQSPSTVGESVTFTAAVTSAGGTVGGSVTFKNGTTTLGTETLSGGSAEYTTSTLAAGQQSITAVYAGDTDFVTSTSPSFTQYVNVDTSSSRVVWVPDYYGQALRLRVGTGPYATPITVALPSCNPNSVAVNNNKAYVVCSVNGGNPDKILVYNAATIRSAAAGALLISPLKTITSTQFKSLIGITFDASNNLWVASYGNNQVDEITATALATTTPTVTASLIDSPSSPVALAFDTNGSLWVTGQYGGGILLNFPKGQLGTGESAIPDYCLATSNVGPGCQSVDGVFLSPEGLALFNGDVWVANNSTGETGNVPGRELVGLKYSGGSATARGTLTVSETFGKSGVPADSPFACPGGLFAGSVHLWVNDESYGELDPQCGAAGDVASNTGGVFDFTPAQLAAQTTTISEVLGYANITGRPGFGGIFVENDQ